MSETKEQNNLQETIKNIEKDMFRKFDEFTKPEMIKNENRSDLLLEKFSIIKEEIENRKYLVKDSSLVAVKTLFLDYYMDSSKGTNVLESVVSLHETLLDIDEKKESLELTTPQIQFIGDTFNNVCTWKSIEEGKKLLSIKNDLKPLYENVWIAKTELQLAGAVVSNIESKWQLGDVGKEEVIITEKTKK